MKKAFRPRISAGLVLTMALALFNLGLFCMLLLAGSSMQQKLREDFSIQVYLDRGILPHQLKEVSQKIGSGSFVARENGIPRMEYESKEKTGKRFIEETGEDFMQFLGKNPLRDAFHVHVRENQLHPDSLSRIKTQLARIPGVFEVEYQADLAASMETNLRKIAGIFLVAAVLFLASMFWILQGSIRSAIHSGRFFIRSMELLGATPWFIRRPYVLAIGLGGMLGGILAAFLLSAACFSAARQFPEAEMLIPLNFALPVILCLVPAGFMLSFIPATFGIRAYQQKKLSDLHRY